MQFINIALVSLIAVAAAMPKGGGGGGHGHKAAPAPAPKPKDPPAPAPKPAAPAPVPKPAAPAPVPKPAAPAPPPPSEPEKPKEGRPVPAPAPGPSGSPAPGPPTAAQHYRGESPATYHKINKVSKADALRCTGALGSIGVGCGGDIKTMIENDAVNGWDMSSCLFNIIQSIPDCFAIVAGFV